MISQVSVTRIVALGRAGRRASKSLRSGRLRRGRRTCSCYQNDQVVLDRCNGQDCGGVRICCGKRHLILNEAIVARADHLVCCRDVEPVGGRVTIVANKDKIIAFFSSFARSLVTEWYARHSECQACQ